MRRLLATLALLLAALVVLPPLFFRVFPGQAPPDLPPADRRIPVGDGIFVSAVIRGQGQPVVLVHGLPGSGHDWRALTGRLARLGQRVIAYDRAGYGRSDARRNGDFRLDASARDLLALLESEGFEDATLVGWSYGGATAIRAARLDPSRIGRLVLIGSAGPWPERPPDPAIFRLLFSAPVMGWVRAVPPVGRALQAGFSAEAFGDETMPDWWLPQLAANFASPHTQETWLGEGAAMPWGEELDPSSLDLPILVIHGEADRLVPLEVAQAIHGRARRSRVVVIEGGSHMLPITHPDEIAERVASFMSVH